MGALRAILAREGLSGTRIKCCKSSANSDQCRIGAACCRQRQRGQNYHLCGSPRYMIRDLNILMSEWSPHVITLEWPETATGGEAPENWRAKLPPRPLERVMK